jgi:shikimate kinase
MKKHIYLTGFMGSGKSTIGRTLARELQRKFIDSDYEIENKYSKEIKDIFASEGESRFRQIEQEMIVRLSQYTESCIISLGGGALISDKNLEIVLNSGFLIYIKSKPEEIWRRIKHSTRRPLLRHEDEFWTREDYLHRIKALLLQREKGYHKAQIIIDRDGKEADEVVEMLKKEIQVIMK